MPGSGACAATCPKARIREIVQEHGAERTNLLHILHDVQEAVGHLSEDDINEVACLLGLSTGEVYGVATFYSLFATRPQGENVIRVCVSPPCHLQAADEVLEAVSQELRLKPGRTSKDGKFTLEAVSCFGLCGVAPALLVNDRAYGNLTPERAREIIRGLRAGALPAGKEA